MQISLQEVMFLLLEWFGATFAMDLKKKPNLATQSGNNFIRTNSAYTWLRGNYFQLFWF